MSPELPSHSAEAQFHIAFYKFVALRDPERVAHDLRILTRGLTGSILVASEGINGVLAGNESALNAAQHALLQDARFAGMQFKRSACSRPPFGRMVVHVKAEIVAVGLAHPSPLPAEGTFVKPPAWRSLLGQENVLVLDNRNSFEFRLGHFHHAIDPGVTHFKDFPRFVEAHAQRWRGDGLRIAMYCTGGIRCEKMSSWMQRILGLDVLQLEGGVLNHFQCLPDAELDWEGECFVFDNRVALNTRLQGTATTAEQVYAHEPDGHWRLQRARRLAAAVGE